MEKLNKYHKFGILGVTISLISNRFSLLPDFVEGFCIGLGVVLLFRGMFSYKKQYKN